MHDVPETFVAGHDGWEDMALIGLESDLREEQLLVLLVVSQLVFGKSVCVHNALCRLVFGDCWVMGADNIWRSSFKCNFSRDVHV